MKRKNSPFFIILAITLGSIVVNSSLFAQWGEDPPQDYECPTWVDCDEPENPDDPQTEVIIVWADQNNSNSQHDTWIYRVWDTTPNGPGDGWEYIWRRGQGSTPLREPTTPHPFFRRLVDEIQQ